MPTPREQEQLLAVQTTVTVLGAGGGLLCENENCKAPEVAAERRHGNGALGLLIFIHYDAYYRLY